MLDKIWDDVMAGPQPQRGLGKFRKLYVTTTPETAGSGELDSGKYARSLSMPTTPEAPATPTTPTTPSPSARKDNVWRSVFNPGSNLANRTMGSQIFDKPNPNTPTVYDWLYSGETKSKNHH